MIETFRAPHRHWHFRRAMLELSSGKPSRQCLERVSYGWNNGLWPAHVDYLAEVAARAAITEGPILECGSGVTTLILAAVAANRGVPVWTLEHLPEWTLAASRHAPRVNVCLAPLRDYGEYAWYDVPKNLPQDIQLIVCDGPPGDIKGGRYGVIPLLARHLKETATLLLDDADREDERAVLARWCNEFGTSVEMRRGYAVVSRIRQGSGGDVVA